MLDRNMAAVEFFSILSVIPDKTVRGVFFCEVAACAAPRLSRSGLRLHKKRLPTEGREP
jgi:hypothetical protein